MRDGHRGECKACFGEMSKARYKKNPGPAIRRAQEWRQKNPERFREVQRRRREERRDELREQDRRRWLNAKYGLTPEAFNNLLSRQNNACAICGRVMGEDLHTNHRLAQYEALLEPLMRPLDQIPVG